MEEILKKLKSLKSVNPDEDYAKRGRILILAHKQKGWGFAAWQPPLLAGPRHGRWPALAFASLLIIIIIGAFLYFNGRDGAVALEKRNGLRLAETNYYQKTVNDISKVTFRIQERINYFLDRVF